MLVVATLISSWLCRSLRESMFLSSWGRGIRSAGKRAWRFGCFRWPEVMILLLGIVLRLSMISNFHYTWNYDSQSHWDVVEWMLRFGAVPNTETLYEGYHPPLFYALSAWLVTEGWTRPTMVAVPVGLGIVRLALIWLGFELHLPRFRIARIVGLALAAVLPASVHMDGMLFGEGLSCLIHTLILILMPFALRREGSFRWVLALWLGVLFGLAFLTKISALVTLGALGLAVGLEFVLIDRPLPLRLKRATPWLLTLAVAVGMSSWYFAQNVRQYDKPLVTSFELQYDKFRVAKALESPVLDRRPLGYVFGWTDDIYLYPYHPAGSSGTYRFFPVALVTAVVDYWDFGFAGYEEAVPGGPPPGRLHAWRYPEISLAAVFGGTLALIATLIAWVCAAVHVFRTRNIAHLALIAAPLLAVVAALQFAVSFPIEHNGVIKATYMMFAAPPLFALFGLAVDWTTRSPARWALTVILALALGAIGWYSLQCRLTRNLPWEPKTVQLTVNHGWEAV